MAGQQIGYIRVSTTGQNTDRQLDGLQLDRVFEDKVSGKSADSPQLNALLAHLRIGETLHVHSIGRMARNLADLLKLIESITGKGVAVQFHKEGLTFTGDDSPMQNMMLQLLGVVAQFERSMINERASEGREAARAREGSSSGGNRLSQRLRWLSLQTGGAGENRWLDWRSISMCPGRLCTGR